MRHRSAWLALASLGAGACNLVFGIHAGEPGEPGGGGTTDAGAPDAEPDHAGGDDGGTCTAGEASCDGAKLHVCDAQGKALPEVDCGVVAACDPIAKRCIDGASLRRLTVGTGRGCVIGDDRKPRCWGYNTGLVPGDQRNMIPSATLVPDVDGVRQISAGGGQQCALQDDGAVVCWGSNDNGEAGQTSGSAVPPAKVPLSSPALEVSAAYRCTCARLATGKVMCWGQLDTGCFGVGGATSGAQATPTEVPGIDDAVELHAGAWDLPTCVRRASGKVWCWTSDALPSEIPGVSDALEIGVSQNVVFVRSESNGVVSSSMPADKSGWTTAATYPMKHASPVTALAAGRALLALHEDGVVSHTLLHEDGVGLLPEPITGQPAGTVVEIASGFGNGYGADLQCLRLAGPLSTSVYCWGDDQDGAIGADAPDVIRTPATIPNFQGATTIRATGSSTVAVMSDGRIMTWGSVPGLPNSESATPHAVTLLGSDNAYVSVGDSNRDAYVLKKSGVLSLWTYGSQTSGKRLLSGTYTGWQWVQESSLWDIALLANGSVVVYGDIAASNEGGIFGNGSTTGAAGDIATVPGISNAKAVAAYFDDYRAGAAFACAIVGAPGTLVCWGQNESGQIGTGAAGGVVTTATPVPIAGETVVSVAVGGEHACAVAASGKVYCWGANEFGQLGYDTGSSDSPQPIQVDGITDAVGVAAGYGHTCVWRNDATKTATCWGLNTRGQLGDGTLDGRFTPLTVSGLSDVVEVTAGWGHTCARHSDGSVACWGLSYRGEVGTGITGQFDEPRQVVGL